MNHYEWSLSLGKSKAWLSGVKFLHKDYYELITSFNSPDYFRQYILKRQKVGYDNYIQAERFRLLRSIACKMHPNKPVGSFYITLRNLLTLPLVPSILQYNILEDFIGYSEEVITDYFAKYPQCRDSEFKRISLEAAQVWEELLEVKKGKEFAFLYCPDSSPRGVFNVSWYEKIDKALRAKDNFTLVHCKRVKMLATEGRKFLDGLQTVPA